MNKDILKLAREAGFAINVSDCPNMPPYWHGAAHNDTFERFAALVAKAEREECAKVCESMIKWHFPIDHNSSVQECVNAIRARSDK